MNCVFLRFYRFDRMKKIARRFYQEKGSVLGGDNNTSKGVLVPISALFDPKSHIIPEQQLSEQDKWMAYAQKVTEECEQNEREYQKILRGMKKK